MSRRCSTRVPKKKVFKDFIPFPSSTSKYAKEDFEEPLFTDKIDPLPSTSFVVVSTADLEEMVVKQEKEIPNLVKQVIHQSSRMGSLELDVKHEQDGPESVMERDSTPSNSLSQDSVVKEESENPVVQDSLIPSEPHDDLQDVFEIAKNEGDIMGQQQIVKEESDVTHQIPSTSFQPPIVEEKPSDDLQMPKDEQDIFEQANLVKLERENADHRDSPSSSGSHSHDSSFTEDNERTALLRPASNPDSASFNKKKFECGVCNRGFSELHNLKSHYRIHTGERRFKCEVCHERFGVKKNLIRHMRVHSDDKGVECEVCHKFYSCDQSLARHMLIHKGEKPFSCDICGASFACQSNLATHKLSHGGEKSFFCNVCGKGFVAKPYLSKHMRTHSGKKPFECEVCKKAFSERSTLRNHLLTHTAEKFECTECRKKFSRPAYLKKHCSTAHGLEILE